MPRPRAHVLALVATPLVVAVGCGEAGEGGASARARDGRVVVALDDYLLAPQRISARAGRVTFAVANRGRIGHTFRLRRQGRTVLEVPTQLNGESATVTVRLEPGSYRMFCVIANHEELGMYGSLVVR